MFTQSISKSAGIFSAKLARSRTLRRSEGKPLQGKLKVSRGCNYLIGSNNNTRFSITRLAWYSTNTTSHEECVPVISSLEQNKIVKCSLIKMLKSKGFIAQLSDVYLRKCVHARERSKNINHTCTKAVCIFLKKRYVEIFLSLSSSMNRSILIFYDRNFLINIMGNYLGVYIFKSIYRITTKL